MLHKFQDRKISIEDCDQSGRPHISVTKADIAAVKIVLEEDARYIVKEIALYVEITSAANHKILTEHFELKKICVHRVPTC